MLSSFSRPTAVAVRRALSLFSPVSPLPQNQQNFTISALTKREFLLLFSKSNAFSFLSETKRRRSCGGQGEPSWSSRPIHPVRPSAVACPSIRTDGLIHLISQKMSGATDTFSCPRWTRLRTEVRQSLPTQIFSNGKKIRSAVCTPQATKKRAKSPFSNRKNGPRAENAPKRPLVCLSEKC